MDIVGVLITALAGAVGWMIKSGWSLAKSHSKLEQDFTSFKLSHIDHPRRLTKVEDAIVALQKSQEKSDGRLRGNHGSI